MSGAADNSRINALRRAWEIGAGLMPDDIEWLRLNVSCGRWQEISENRRSNIASAESLGNIEALMKAQAKMQSDIDSIRATLAQHWWPCDACPYTDCREKLRCAKDPGARDRAKAESPMVLRARRENAEISIEDLVKNGSLEDLRSLPVDILMSRRPWPDPTPEDIASPEFEAVWQLIKNWDINVPDVYAGYCGATGNHVRAILDALWMARAKR